VWQYRADRVLLHISFKSRQRVVRAPTCRHVPCSIGPCFPAKVGSGVATCPVAPDPTSLIGRAPVPSRVPWFWTPPPCKGGLRCATCPTVSNPASLQGRAPERYVSYCSGSCPPTGSALLPPPHALRFPVDRGP
jgi:hypothetical protein